MSPSILVRKSDSRVRLVGGASGGPRIITATAQVLLNFLGKGMSLSAAVLEPRIHSQLFPQTVFLEDVTLDCLDCLTLDQNGDPIPGRYQHISSATNTVLVNALKSRGHNLTIDTGANFGVCQFIGQSPCPALSPSDPSASPSLADVELELQNRMTAMCDPRKGGRPAAAASST
jgi:gamma-glutamyltranspeptidase